MHFPLLVHMHNPTLQEDIYLAMQLFAVWTSSDAGLGHAGFPECIDICA